MTGQTLIEELVQALGTKLGDQASALLAGAMREHAAEIADDSPIGATVLRLVAGTVEREGPEAAQAVAAKIEDAMRSGDPVMQLLEVFEADPTAGEELTALAERLTTAAAADRRRWTRAAIVLAAFLRDLGEVLRRSALLLVRG